MPDEFLERLLHRFALAARGHHEAMEALDEERAARQADLLVRLAGSILERGEPGGRGLVELTLRDDDAVAGMAAIYGMRSDPDRCISVLRRIARGNGMLAFRAAVAVERWEKGEWGLG
jgi:hypothetical protein